MKGKKHSPEQIVKILREAEGAKSAQAPNPVAPVAVSIVRHYEAVPNDLSSATAATRRVVATVTRCRRGA
jgi:hypothetical protein